MKRIFSNLVQWLLPFGLHQWYVMHPRKVKEIDKVKGNPRYQHGVIDLPTHQRFKYVDGLTFSSQFNEIFEDEIYYFDHNSGEIPFIIDAGANVGVAVVYWKNLYPQAKILAFEPDKGIFDVLCENSSKYNDITVLNVGLFDEEGVVDFFFEGADSGSLVRNKESEKRIQSKIEVRKLSDFLAEKVDLLKIDIEGAEYRVIKEASSLLKNVKYLFIEYHSFCDQEQMLADLLQVLKDCDFRVKLQTTKNLKRRPFSDQSIYNGMDMQVNIFATHND